MIRFTRLQRSLAVAAALVLVAGAALALLYGRGESAPANAGYWEPVTAQLQTNELVSSGKLLPAQMLEIPSPAAGVIASLAVTWGDAVVQGQHLGRIDSPELMAQLRTSQAALLRGKLQDGGVLAGEEPADVLNARRRVLTAQTALNAAQARQVESGALYSKGFVSRNDDEAAKTEAENAALQVTLAQEELKATARKFAPDQVQAIRLEADNKHAELAQIRERQKQLTLTSPLTGVVLYPQPQESRDAQPARELTVGARVAAGEAIMAIGDTSSFLIRAYCTEAEFAWLEAGADAEITLAALPDQTFTAKVTKVLGQARSRRNTASGDESSYEFLVAFPAPGQLLPEAQRRKLRMGGTAKLKITQKSATRQTSLPLAAIVWAPDGAAQVRWRASATDTPQMKPVRIVRSSVGEVLVRDELAGEVWVAGGAPDIAESTSGLKQMFGLEN